MRMLGVVVICMACHQQIKQTEQVDQTERKALASDTEKVKNETKSQDPTDIGTKTIMQDNAVAVQEPDGSVVIAKVQADKPLKFAKGSKVLGVIPVATKSIEQDKHVGAKLDVMGSDTKQLVTGTDDKTKKTLKDLDKTTDTGFGWKFYLTVALIAALVIGGVLVILKYKLWRPL